MENLSIGFFRYRRSPEGEAAFEFLSDQAGRLVEQPSLTSDPGSSAFANVLVEYLTEFTDRSKQGRFSSGTPNSTKCRGRLCAGG